MVNTGSIFHSGGTRRIEPPARSLERLLPQLGKFGITRLANITGLDWIGIPVVTAIRPLSRSLVVAQGKGVTLLDAKVSALMESIELFHAERPAIPVRIASLRDLAREGAAIIDCTRLPRSGAEPFDEAQAIAWTVGTDLIAGTGLWVPYACVAVDDSLSALPIPHGIPVHSNGLASGNSIEEATVHALCELIERDAIALWHAGPDDYREGTAVDPVSIDDPLCRALIDKYERAGIDVHLFDLTSDIGLPVYEVFIRERTRAGDRAAFSAVGSGCHPWRGIALSRALTEAAQCRLTHIAGAREDLAQGDYAVSPERMRQIARYTSLTRAPGRRFRDEKDVEPDPGESFAATLARIVDALRAVGCPQIVSVDLTSPSHGISVVRLLVPGLEGLAFDVDYAPGQRLRRINAAAGAAA